MSEISKAVTIVKQHKVVIGFGVLGAIVLLYIIAKGSSLASGGVASGGESALDLQYQSLAAATGVKQAQTQAALDVASINANTANTQTAAQLAVASKQIDANVIEQSNAIAGTLALTELQGEISTQQQVNSLKEASHEVDVKASLAQSQIDSITGLYKEQIESQSALESTVLASSLKTGRSSTGITQILAALFGQGPAAIAANQPSQVANSAGAILNGIGGIVRGLFG